MHEFQTLIVGAFGFLGVMATIATNAWLQRRQHDRQVRHEAAVLRVALRAELEIIRNSFRDRIQTIESTRTDGSTGMLVPLDSMTDVYRRLTEHLGLLSESEIRLVMRAYLLVQQMPDRIRMLQRRYGTPDEKAAGFAFVEGRLFPALKQLHENYLVDIESAISAISR